MATPASERTATEEPSLVDELETAFQVVFSQICLLNDIIAGLILSLFIKTLCMIVVFF